MSTPRPTSLSPPRVAGHQTQGEVAFDAQLARLAGPSHLVCAQDELVALGLGEAGIRARAAAGRLHRVHHGVYALVPAELLNARARYRAATLACTGSRHAAALSHRSAADLHGLRDCHRRVVEVILAGRSTHRHPGIQVHRSLHLDLDLDLDLDADVVHVHGIATTTVSRTLLDLAAVVSRRELERALDQAEVLRVFDVDGLRDQLARNPRHPGGGALRATLDRHLAGSTVTDSELEERMRAFEEDRTRDQRLTAAGWRVIRITWRQLTERPHQVAGILRRLLAS